MRQVFLTLVVLGCAVMALWLGPQVFSGLDELSTASNGNQQYSVSRVEVELAELHVAISEVEIGRAPLSDVRNRYDIFYSRVNTISAQVYSNDLLSSDDHVRGYVDALQSFLYITIDMLDGNDAELRADLPVLREYTSLLIPSAHDLSSRLVTLFAGNSEEDRVWFSYLIRNSAATAAATMGAVLIAITLLLLQVRITRRRAYEAERARIRLEATIEASLDAILVSSSSGAIVTHNSAARALFGRPSQGFANCTLDDLFASGDLSGTSAGRMELSARRLDGSTFPAEVSITAGDSKHGSINIVFVRDIEARKQQEGALIAARDAATETEKVRSHFFAVMSHEMRTPLNGLIGMLDLIKGEGMASDKQAERLGIASNAAEVLLRHVNDALDIARIEAGHINVEQEPFDIADVVEAVIALGAPLAEQANVRITTKISKEVAKQYSDPYRVQQVLTNLVGNAIKFTPDGHVLLNVFIEDGILHIDADDTGQGVPDADRTRIFDDFVILENAYDRRNGGTGLGLGISRRIARALGGDLKCLPVPNGVGSRFRLTLPDRPVSDAAVIENDESTKSLHVLVIEDNETNQIVLGEMLLSLGHTVEYANDGLEGFEAAERGAYDLILTDISMPRLDGVAATRRIRAGSGPCANIPIVGVTAHAQPEEHIRFRAAGMNECLVKPLRRAQLVSLIANYFGADAAPSEAMPVENVGDISQWLDHLALAGLMETLGEVKFQKVLSMFLHQGEALIESLDANPNALIVHRFAGSAALFGIAGFMADLQKLEVALRNCNQEVIVEQSARIKENWPMVAGALAEFQNDTAPADTSP